MRPCQSKTYTAKPNSAIPTRERLPDVYIQEGAELNVYSTFGQLGPDAAFFSHWVVGAQVFGSDTEALLRLNGDHFIGFDQLEIRGRGQVKYEVGGVLTDVPLAPPAAWKKFVIENKGAFMIEEGQAVGLTGGWYSQTHGGEDPTIWFEPGSSLSIAGFAGSTGAPPYSFDVTTGVVKAYEIASVSAKTDIRIQDATVDFYSPGWFSKAGGPEQRSRFTFVAKDGYNFKETYIKNTPIKFHNWAPEGRYTSATQVGGQLGADGKVKLDGSTHLSLRIDMDPDIIHANQMDTVFAATNTVTMVGNSLSLALEVRNSQPGQTVFQFDNFLWSTALTAPTPPFGGGITVNGGGGGWTPMVTPDSQSLDLMLVWG